MLFFSKLIYYKIITRSPRPCWLRHWGCETTRKVPKPHPQ